MKVHDVYINQILENLSMRHVKECTLLGTSNWNIQKTSDFIMDKEVGVELGATGSSSVSINLCSSTIDIEDKILLIGNEIDQLKGKHPHFARVTIVQIKDQGDDNSNYKNIKAIDRAKFGINLEGTMLRASSSENRECVRISKKAKADGMNFSVLGSAFINKLKQLDFVVNAQIFYIVGDEALVSFVMEYPEKIFKSVDAMNHMFEDIELDCASCAIKEVCDEVEGMRETHRQNSKG